MIFVDLDGVLADFDRGYREEFGTDASKATDNVDWKKVRARQGFYERLHPMPDALEMFGIIGDICDEYGLGDPTILTGVPASVPEAPENKIRWVHRHISRFVPVITCPSKNKSHFCERGDVLIDDWEKYRDLWIAKGGVFITHTDPASTISVLRYTLRMAVE